MRHGGRFAEDGIQPSPGSPTSYYKWLHSSSSKAEVVGASGGDLHGVALARSKWRRLATLCSVLTTLFRVTESLKHSLASKISSVYFPRERHEPLPSPSGVVHSALRNPRLSSVRAPFFK